MRIFTFFILFSLIFSEAYAITIDIGAMRAKKRKKQTKKEEIKLKEERRLEEEGRIKVIEEKLKNGFKVYIIPKDSGGNSAVFLWVKSGASDEPENFFGGAHILEHIVFKGSPERGVSEVSDAIERVGGYINAWTSYDNTVYWALVPTEHVLVPLEVLRDIVWNPAFSDEEFEREKEVVLEEWRRGQDIPIYRLYHKFFEEMYKDHPYGHPVIGYQETIKSITKDLVLNFHSNFYSPENAFLIIVGDFDEKRILEKTKEIFGKIKPKSKPKKLDVSKKPNFSGPKSFFISGKEKEAHVILGFLGYPYSLTYSVYFDIISDILEKRLYEKLRIKDVVVNSVDVDYWSPSGIGMFEISYSAKGENIGKAFDIIYDELLKIKTFGVSEKELELAKSSILSGFYKELQSVRSIAYLIGYSVQLSDDPYAPYKYLEILKSTDTEKIKQILQDIIQESRFLSGIYINDEEKNYAEELTQKSENITFKKEVKLPFSYVEEKDGIKKYVSQNGVRIILKKIEGSGTISVFSVFPGGNIFYDKPGIPNLTAKVITRGTESRSAETILEEVKSIGGSLYASADFDIFSVSSSFLKDKYEKAFDIFFDVLLNPSFDEKEIEKMKEDIIEDLRTRYDNPQVQAIDEFMKLLFDGTIYAFPAGISEEVLKDAKRQDILDFWNFVNSDPEKIVISVVGDFKDENQILTSLYFYGEKFFTRKKERNISFPQKVSCNTVNEEKTVQREGNQVHILVGFCAPSLLENDFLAFRLISASVSGMGGRLFMNLREKKGLAYVVAPVRRGFISAGFFGGYIASAPEKLHESLESLKEEIKNISQLEDSEFERGKNIVLGAIRRELQENSSWARVLAQNEFLGKGFDYYKKIQDEIKDMKKDEALSIFRKYVESNSFSTLILGPQVN